LPLGWSKKENFGTKLLRVVKKIESLQNKGYLVSLVGISAGAGAALNAYSINNEVERVICISGKINHPASVRSEIYNKNPDFKKSMHRIKDSIGILGSKNLLKNIMSIHPTEDSTVPIEDTIIDGAIEKIFYGRGHASGIFYAITIGAPLIAGFIREKSTKV
jgi:hypothetical protein